MLWAWTWATSLVQWSGWCRVWNYFFLLELKGSAPFMDIGWLQWLGLGAKSSYWLEILFVLNGIYAQSSCAENNFSHLYSSCRSVNFRFRLLLTIPKSFLHQTNYYFEYYDNTNITILLTYIEKLNGFNIQLTINRILYYIY